MDFLTDFMEGVRDFMVVGDPSVRRNTGEFPKFSKLAVGRNIRLVVSFNQGTASLQPYQCIPAGFFG